MTRRHPFLLSDSVPEHQQYYEHIRKFKYLGTGCIETDTGDVEVPIVKHGEEHLIDLRRYLYEINVDSVPLTSEVVTVCGNDRCVNPEHCKVIVPIPPSGEYEGTLEINGENISFKWLLEHGYIEVFRDHWLQTKELDACVCTKAVRRHLYQQANGPIQDTSVLDGTCGLPDCICPKHQRLKGI